VPPHERLELLLVSVARSRRQPAIARRLHEIPTPRSASASHRIPA
jgi:hypothetical protein